MPCSMANAPSNTTANRHFVNPWNPNEVKSLIKLIVRLKSHNLHPCHSFSFDKKGCSALARGWRVAPGGHLNSQHIFTFGFYPNSVEYYVKWWARGVHTPSGVPQPLPVSVIANIVAFVAVGLIWCRQATAEGSINFSGSKTGTSHLISNRLAALAFVPLVHSAHSHPPSGTVCV